jgi:pyridoxal phosphate phosphatase PHOSPHO2
LQLVIDLLFNFQGYFAAANMSTAATRTLVVYDFDWSFVDQDTDRWVFEVLSTELRRLLQDRKSGGSQCMPDTV